MISASALKKNLAKLERDGADASFRAVFRRNFEVLAKMGTQGEAGNGTQNNMKVSGETAFICEADITPLTKIQEAHLYQGHASDEMAAQTVIIKLNGGLGTSMGLDKAKSLLKVKGELTFLDIIIAQVEKLRKKHHAPFPLLLMNSFNTSADTLGYLKENHAEFYNQALGSNDLPLEFIQHREPKLLADNLEPASFPEEPALEWCPPGHGDFYSAIYGSGALEKLIEAGFRYAFVSNSDNLGATFDPQIANYFEETRATIMLELANKTALDVKGGHIVIKDGKMLLREVAQIHPDDMEQALDLEKHPYFNTNSLWIDLQQLYETLSQTQGVLELPLIVNRKNLRPKDKKTPEVIQLETAIGAGISVLDKTAVINVQRNRFLPVKLDSDLETLRSDKYVLDDDYCLVCKK